MRAEASLRDYLSTSSLKGTSSSGHSKPQPTPPSSNFSREPAPILGYPIRSQTTRCRQWAHPDVYVEAILPRSLLHLKSLSTQLLDGESTESAPTCRLLETRAETISGRYSPEWIPSLAATEKRQTTTALLIKAFCGPGFLLALDVGLGVFVFFLAVSHC
jgi:hypothetical protein